MITLNVNGTTHQVDADPVTPLLYVLRNDLRLNSPRFGCGLGQCGACTVVADGQPIFSCQIPVSVLEGRAITTLEGLGSAANPSPVQQAFIDEQAAQCGFCIPGMIMRAHALLKRHEAPTDQQMRDWMQPNLCRCGTHGRIMKAIRRAAGQMS